MTSNEVVIVLDDAVVAASVGASAIDMGQNENVVKVTSYLDWSLMMVRRGMVRHFCHSSFLKQREVRNDSM